MRPKRPSFDLQELLLSSNSPPWPDSSPRIDFQKGDEQESSAGDWVDKLVVNKQEFITEGDNPFRRWNGNSGPLPEIFCPGFRPDMGIYSDQQYDTQESRKDSHEYETEITDDSDELEITTSDSSEADMLWQFNLPKVTKPASGFESRIKKPQITLVKSPEIR